MSPLDQLLAHDRTTQAIAAVAGRTSWDQETMMPRGAAAQRSEELAALESVLHARRTDPRVGDWIERARPGDPQQEARLRLIARVHNRAAAIPADLAMELARVTSLSQGQWAEARAAEDVAAFVPVLERVLDLRRQEAQAYVDAGFGDGSLYDALLDDYEPGASAGFLSDLFGRMRPRLVDLRQAIMDSSRDPAPLTGSFDAEGQRRLSEEVARAFGYDFARGRIDLAVHPFSSGSGADVRITTRVSPGDPFNCLYSTIHEVGHAGYEQNVSAEFALSALGQGVSMGVHESQSRIYENQLGRSRAFCGWLYGRMRDVFGELSVADEDAFYAAVNRVHGGFIRTEADEVHYNLHVMMRFDLERALLSGDLAVRHLEAAWNDRFKADFGAEVEQPSDGMLQDVHWSVGLIGYFPTYSLGNVYAGCLNNAMRAALPTLDDQLARGDATGAVGWLKDNLQVFGSLRPPRPTIQHATGEDPDEGPLLDYLDDKFGALYGL